MKITPAFFLVTVFFAAAAVAAPSNQDNFPCPLYPCYLPASGCDLIVPGHRAEGPCPCPICINLSPKSLLGDHCKDVECLPPSCGAGEELYIPDGACCYRCRRPRSELSPPRQSPSCPPPHTICLDPLCKPWEIMVIPEGQCCPVCKQLTDKLSG